MSEDMHLYGKSENPEKIHSLPEYVRSIDIRLANLEEERLPARMNTSERWQERVGGIYMATVFFVGLIGAIVGFVAGYLIK